MLWVNFLRSTIVTYKHFIWVFMWSTNPTRTPISVHPFMQPLMVLSGVWQWYRCAQPISLSHLGKELNLCRWNFLIDYKNVDHVICRKWVFLTQARIAELYYKAKCNISTWIFFWKWQYEHLVPIIVFYLTVALATRSSLKASWESSGCVFSVAVVSLGFWDRSLSASRKGGFEFQFGIS